MASSKFELELTLPQVEKEISKYQSLLSLSPRSDPHRPTHLLRLAGLRTTRNALLDRKYDLDKTIDHLIEAVLLPSQPGQHVVFIFFQLASGLLSRFTLYKQLEDIKSSLKYFRFLQINFYSLEAVNISRDVFTSRLVQVLANSLRSVSGDIIQSMEEMAALSHVLLSSGSSDVSESTGESRGAVMAFSVAVFRTLHLEDVKQPPEQVIEVLREAAVFIPDSQHVSLALARCLLSRFKMTHVIKDHEEAMSIADKIVAGPSTGDSLTWAQEEAIWLIVDLVVTKFNCYANPVYLEDSIHRLRALLHVPSLPEQHRTVIVGILDDSVQLRSKYFSVTGNSLQTPVDELELGLTRSFLLPVGKASHQWDVGPDGDPAVRMAEQSNLLNEILTAIRSDTTLDVDMAVERARTLLPPPHSGPSHGSSALVFAHILKESYQRTKRPDYLNEAITTYRELRKVSTPNVIRFNAGYGLVLSLLLGLILFLRKQDFEEVMQLFPMVANDVSGEVYRRFYISCLWADCARPLGSGSAHPSISIAYETAMSLMQETLIFSPTLQTQHFRLVKTLKKEELPSDYVSYQIETSRHKQAVESLERGRALLWSEMRGLRTSTDKLRAVDPALADEFADISRKLESATMSVSHRESEEMMGNSATETGRREGMDSIGRLIVVQRRLLEQRDSLISRIQSFPGLGDFLKPPSFDSLNSAATHGPVIIINQSRWRSDIIILHKDLPPSVVSTPSNFRDRANRLKENLLRVRKEKGLDSKDYDRTLASILADLYELVGKPVIEGLRRLKVPEKSRVWWCPTSAFCSLPLHAMGPITSNHGDDAVYFMDLYISSYTPTLSALIESRKPGSQSRMLDKPSLLLVAQPETLPGAWGEIDVLEAVGSPVTTLVSEMATPTTVVASLRDHRFVHFVCHGLLETGKPFDASFELHGGNLTLLEIVRSQLPTAEFAFLSACHTAEPTEGSIADEGLHLAAAIQYCGFRSVVGTMWAMADTDGRDLSKHFYKSIFSESTGQRGVPHYERSARSLQFAVKKLRKKRGITLERWVNFVHYGA